MKKVMLMLAIITIAIACNAPKTETPSAEASTVTLPYTATYSSQFSQDVSDTDLLTVLGSYKNWENGDIKALRNAFGDSLTYTSWNGTVTSGPTDNMTNLWSTFRDSLSSAKIEMQAWIKLKSLDKQAVLINVWYKEVDTYKSGKIDSAEWHDINVIGKNGKISWYAQYRRPFKVK